ncbi:MAG: hypothetical protein HQM02_12865 [Magnetococcales bacterium]|nr:hypothetical protein [Magnetococcales bacterium]MBF0311073.1 hypothetical protein [Magnetococcales bacterium]
MTYFEHLGKMEVVRILLEKEGRVLLCLDATSRGVDVPRRFAADPGLRLILNRQMPQPIEIGADTIESELRFGGIPHYCVIPYSALWGAFNPDTGHGTLWPNSMPDAIRRNYERYQSLPAPAFEQQAQEARGGEAALGFQRKVTTMRRPPGREIPPPVKEKPHLELVQGDAPVEEGELEGPYNPRKKNAPHLRLVK